MCEYCEGISNPISFPQKVTYENGETQEIQDGFRINLKEKTLETYQKDFKTGESIVVFSRKIDYCPFCGIELEEMEDIINRKDLEKNNPRKAVINFCRNIKTHDIEYLEQANHNLYILEHNKSTDYLLGCPNNYGLDFFVGLCWKEYPKEMTNKEKEELCRECWEKALR